MLGVRGCLDARKNRALSDYSEDVTQIVNETAQTSKSFFDKLSEPGDLSVTDFIAAVDADRSAVDSYRSRIDALDPPGDMGDAHSDLELVYELRSAAMNEIADQISTALGDVGAEKATAVIARQMRTLLASDVLYAEVVRPEIDAVLTDNGIEGDDVPKSIFVPEDGEWLDESATRTALEGVSGAATAETTGIHGLGLVSTGINGTELVPESTVAVSAEEAPEVEVAVQNQGDSPENGVTVTVTAGSTTLQETISTIEPEEIVTVTIPLTPAPKGTVTLEVEVQLVPGEQLGDNNEASYTVEFE